MNKANEGGRSRTFRLFGRLGSPLFVSFQKINRRGKIRKKGLLGTVLHNGKISWPNRVSSEPMANNDVIRPIDRSGKKRVCVPWWNAGTKWNCLPSRTRSVTCGPSRVWLGYKYARLSASRVWSNKEQEGWWKKRVYLHNDVISDRFGSPGPFQEVVGPGLPLAVPGVHPAATGTVR